MTKIEEARIRAVTRQQNRAANADLDYQRKLGIDRACRVMRVPLQATDGFILDTRSGHVTGPYESLADAQDEVSDLNTWVGDVVFAPLDSRGRVLVAF